MKENDILEKAKEMIYQGLFQAEIGKEKAGNMYEQAKKKDEDIDEHVGIACGVVLSLFGGQFATTFAFVEAFQQIGFSGLRENLNILKDQIEVARDAVSDDDVADNVKQLSPQELASRKFLIACNAMDPEVLQKAFSALWICFLNASSAVRLKFAKVVTLGCSIGEFIEKPAQKYLVPTLQGKLHEKYHKWIPDMVKYICRLIGTSLAFRLFRILATISTSIRGGNMILENVNSLCRKRGFEFLTQGPADEALAFGTVALGIYAQLIGPQNPFVIRLLLFPLTFTEQVLTFFVQAT